MSKNMKTKIVRFLGLMAIASLMALTLSHAGAQTVSPAEKSGPAPAGNSQNGKKLFTSYGCYECHGNQAQGGSAGPRLGPNPTPYTDLVKYIRQPTREMPPYTSKVVSDQDLADIYAFLQSLPQPPKADSIPVLK